MNHEPPKCNEERYLYFPADIADCKNRTDTLEEDFGNYRNRTDALDDDLTGRMSTVEDDVTLLKTGKSIIVIITQYCRSHKPLIKLISTDFNIFI